MTLPAQIKTFLPLSPALQRKIKATYWDLKRNLSFDFYPPSVTKKELSRLDKEFTRSMSYLSIVSAIDPNASLVTNVIDINKHLDEPLNVEAFQWPDKTSSHTEPLPTILFYGARAQHHELFLSQLKTCISYGFDPNILYQPSSCGKEERGTLLLDICWCATEDTCILIEKLLSLGLSYDTEIYSSLNDKSAPVHMKLIDFVLATENEGLYAMPPEVISLFKGYKREQEILKEKLSLEEQTIHSSSSPAQKIKI